MFYTHAVQCLFRIPHWKLTKLKMDWLWILMLLSSVTLKTWRFVCHRDLSWKSIVSDASFQAHCKTTIEYNGSIRPFIEVSLNVCKLNPQSTGNVFGKIVLEELFKKISAPIKCPFKKVIQWNDFFMYEFCFEDFKIFRHKYLKLKILS